MMLPLVVDATRVRMALIGNGARAHRRLQLLDEAGATGLVIYAECPSDALADAARERLVHRLPNAQELAQAQLVFIADPSPSQRAELAAVARAGGALVHVEDVPGLSNLHAPAVVRRGDLTVAVSTAGRSPALAAHVKRFLDRLFGPEWQTRIDDLAALRRRWRDTGADAATLARRTDHWVESQGWLPANDATGASSPGTSDAEATQRSWAIRPSTH
ncbi:MAG TPA: NAD(P)-dependent oxidoreductase [Stellaceae bacterium]|nr:NAD(P)-dependent oxidoreductase [Stellaceae bacterium]